MKQDDLRLFVKRAVLTLLVTVLIAVGVDSELVEDNKTMSVLVYLYVLASGMLLSMRKWQAIMPDQMEVDNVVLLRLGVMLLGVGVYCGLFL